MIAAARLWRDDPVGRALAVPALASSALLLVGELGFDLSPSSVTPGWEWPIVAGYAAYAALAVGLLRVSERRR
jgi:hypothetical protein